MYPAEAIKHMIGKKNMLGTNLVTQIGIVVKDIEQTSQAYADLFGVKTPGWRWTDPHEKTHAEYRGKPTNARAKLAFFKFKNITLELIEPDGEPSTWREFLETRGEGVHHVAFNVKDAAGKVQALAARDMGVAQKGDFTGGHYAYMDSQEMLKVILELLS